MSHYYPISSRAYHIKVYAKRKAIIQKLKARPCMDCGGQFPPYAMDFDHRDSETKRHGVAHVLRFGAKSFQDEIAKCDIVCANCHRIRTWKAKYETGIS